ncbi:hypothetical protein [Kushneria phyllosphaerae]|nr:hypothetical protein [Kushneria phyllosphaerae]
MDKALGYDESETFLINDAPGPWLEQIEASKSKGIKKTDKP